MASKIMCFANGSRRAARESVGGQCIMRCICMISTFLDEFTVASANNAVNGMARWILNSWPAVVAIAGIKKIMFM